jgi:hypothetical protein
VDPTADLKPADLKPVDPTVDLKPADLKPVGRALAAVRAPPVGVRLQAVLQVRRVPAVVRVRVELARAWWPARVQVLVAWRRVQTWGLADSVRALAELPRTGLGLRSV